MPSRKEIDHELENTKDNVESIKLQIDVSSIKSFEQSIKKILPEKGIILFRSHGHVSLEIIPIDEWLKWRAKFMPTVFTINIVDGTTIKSYPSMLFIDAPGPQEVQFIPYRGSLDHKKIQDIMTYLSDPDTINKLIRAHAAITHVHEKSVNIAALIAAFLFGLFVGGIFLRKLIIALM